MLKLESAKTAVDLTTLVYRYTLVLINRLTYNRVVIYYALYLLITVIK